MPDTLGAADLLAEMRRRRVREAIVIDEYGGTAGVVTFESLMERIIGDTGGEFGGSARIVVRTDGSADIDGLTLVGDVNAQFGLHIDEETYNTVGGYVLGRLGRRARVGDTFDVEGRRMRVEQLDGLRVARVWLSKPGKSLSRRQLTTKDTKDTKGRCQVYLCAVSSVQRARARGTLLVVPHDHAHDGAHGHSHVPAGVSERTLRAALVLTLAFVTLEALAGWFGPSLALLSDAGHNLQDAVALGFSWYALSIASRRSHHGMTFGYHRVGVLAALANAVSLACIGLFLGWEAIERIRQPPDVERSVDDRRGGGRDRRERRNWRSGCTRARNTTSTSAAPTCIRSATPHRPSASSSPACSSKRQDSRSPIPSSRC